MPRPSRILFLATDLSTGGGVNRVIRDLAVLFRRRLAADVSIVEARSSGGAHSYALPADIPVESHRQQGLPAYFRLLLGLRRTLPHAVISSWTQDNILVTIAFLFTSTEVILVEHASWHFHRWPIRLLRRLIYPLASRLVVLNRRDLEHYRRFLKSVVLIPDPVPALPMPQGRREKLIIAVGHLEPLKNFEDAIRAIAASRLEADGWSLTIIGSGSRQQQLDKLIAELGLQRTRIHPPTEDLASWYARASLLVLPSRLESFSLVLAEAMLSGVVPVAFESDGPAYILEDFPANLVPMGDVDALAERMRSFAQTEDLAVLRDDLRRSIERRFAPDVIADQWDRLLKTSACEETGPR